MTTWIGKHARSDWRRLPYESIYTPVRSNSNNISIGMLKAWLTKNVGNAFETWDFAWMKQEDGLSIVYQLIWRFKHKEHKVLFDLTWTLND